MAGNYGSSVVIRDERDGSQLKLYPDGGVKVSGDVTIVGTDIQLGAVELKDGGSDNRAQIYSSGAIRVSGDAFVSGNGDYGTVTVSTSPTVVISGRNDLKGVVFSPLGTMYFGLDGSVSSTTGIQLVSGDVYSDGGVGVYTGNVYGVTGAGTVDVRYQRRW